MANIALVSLDITHSAATATELMLQSLGHTVSKLTSASATSTVLQTYDLIVWVRGSNIEAQTAEVIDAFYNGVPVLSGYAGGVTTAQYMPIQAAKLAFGNISTTGMTSETRVTIWDKHEIFSTTYHPGQSVQVSSAATFLISLDRNNLSPNLKMLAGANSKPQYVAMVYAPIGTENLDGVKTSAPFAHFSFMYNSYTTDAIALVDNTIRLMVSPKVISGVVKDTNDTPTQRTINAVNLELNIIGGTTTSDVNGNYSLRVMDGVDYAVFAVDDVAGPLIEVG